MELIDKSALVAEIERLKAIYSDDENIQNVAKYNILVDILFFLDTLKVKDVDLEKEVYEHLWKGRIGTDISKPIYFSYDELLNVASHFAEWQKAQDQETIELAEDHAMFAGMEKMREEMMKDAVEAEVVDGYKYIPHAALIVNKNAIGQLKTGDKVKLIIIKEDEE